MALSLSLCPRESNHCSLAGCISSGRIDLLNFNVLIFVALGIAFLAFQSAELMPLISRAAAFPLEFIH